MFRPHIKIILAILTLLISVVLVSGIWYISSLKPVKLGDTSPQIFTVSDEESAGSIVSRLEKQKIIRSSLAAKIYLKATNQEKKLSPGTYSLNPKLPATETLSQLFRGPKNIKVTIPEGWRREQIALRISSLFSEAHTNFDVQAFIDQTATMEGQLFPDTYLISPRSSTSDIVNLLHRTFLQKSGLNIDNPALNYPSELTDKQILIIASLVEREAAFEADRQIVASIIKKRLLSSWPLQIDATIQYAISSSCPIISPGCDWWPPVSNVNYPSAYNTYQNLGLPPGPICNPGISSILAVKNSTDTDYWYYLTGNDGKTYYAETLSQHNRNIDKYLRP